MRADLTSEERSWHTLVRKQLYEKEAEVSRQAGVKPKSGPKGGRPKGFTSDMAEKTGRSQRSVQRDLKLIDPVTGKPKEKAPKEKTPTGFFQVSPGIKAARLHYVSTCVEDRVDLDTEVEVITDMLREIKREVELP